MSQLPATSTRRSPPRPTGALAWRALRKLLAVDMADLAVELADALGPVFEIQAGPMRLVFLTAPRHFEHVLVTEARRYKKSALLSELRHVTGNGLLISEGDDWRRQRRAANPSFSRQSVRGLAPVMAGCAEEIRARFAGFEEGAVVDMSFEMVHAAMAVLLRCMFSDSLKADPDAMHRAVNTAMRAVSRRMVSPVKIPVGWPTPTNRRLRASVSVLDAEVDRILAERRATAEPGDDLLGQLIASGETTEQELRDHCLTSFVAGHDTVAMALAWAWCFLALNPDAEARLHDEAVRVIGDGPLEAHHLDQLEYASWVVQESMRLYPQPGTLFRSPLEDDVIDGFHVPAGADVALSTHALHRSPDLWDEPERFDPERFSPARAEGRHRYAYLPFGGGQRACIGKAFAMQEAPAILAVLAKEFRFERAWEGEMRAEVAAVTTPKGGLPVRVRRW